MPPADGRDEEQAGFTLIEMIVVLAILAMVGGLVVARGPQRSAALDMRAAVETVAQALRGARGRAIASNRGIRVRFDPGTATLQVDAAPAQTLPRGFVLSVVTGADQGAAILFLPDGSSSGGRVELAGEGRRAQVGVDWLTGRISVADAP